MPILFQACLELFIAWSESLFTEDKYQMGIYDVVSRFAMCSFFNFPFYLEPLCCIPVAFIAICFVSHPFWIPTVFNHAVSSGSLFATLLLSGAKHSSLFVCVVRFLIRFCVCDFYFDF